MSADGRAALGPASKRVSTAASRRARAHAPRASTPRRVVVRTAMLAMPVTGRSVHPRFVRPFVYQAR